MIYVVAHALGYGDLSVIATAMDGCTLLLFAGHTRASEAAILICQSAHPCAPATRISLIFLYLYRYVHIRNLHFCSGNVCATMRDAACNYRRGFIATVLVFAVKVEIELFTSSFACFSILTF